MEGHWLERNQSPQPLKGRTLIVWQREDWFTMVTKIVFPDGDREEISFQYRGRVNTEERQYTYVLQHSQLGRVEGEGWVLNESIVQRFWVLGDQQRRSGFETFHRLTDRSYYLASGILAGHYLTSTLEATFTRQL